MVLSTYVGDSKFYEINLNKAFLVQRAAASFSVAASSTVCKPPLTLFAHSAIS